jgi:hypothetical protein
MYYVKLKSSLYGLKQLGRMCYNWLSEYLLQNGYSHRILLISVYIDDLNIISNTQDIDEARNHLKTEFDMKDNKIWVNKILLRFVNRAPSLRNFSAPIYLCAEIIGEIQYGQSISK